ncbi:MAG: type III toxin-antitoxin system ToxN/AbiQ family toxin, partial [Treponema sp.]|nr:type III toxin-antitoxin system ToxN/AbiQ family toxin [Treponema sp.]
FIRKNADKIEKTAKNLYKAKKNQKNEPEYKQNILNVTLDFVLLEKKCQEWNLRRGTPKSSLL